MSNIKIQDVDQRIQYSATSSQTEFTIPFPFLEDSDIVVYQNSTLLTQGASPGQYGLSGAGSPSGGTMTLVTGATLDDVITIYGNMPIDRTSIYSATLSNLTGSDLNGDFNREVIMMKQIETTQSLLQLQYYPYAEVSQDVSVTRDRWLPILGASQTWRMNSAGTAIEAIDFDAGGGGAPTDAQYLLATADGSLPNGVDFGALTTGLLKHSVSGGVSTPATAVNAVDYWAPGDDLTRSSAPTGGNDVTNKTYVDALINGFNFLNRVRVATTANFTSTYDNRTSGVGATLTASSNGAASIDGTSLSLNDRVLFKDQSTTYENGIYYVSQVGDGSNPAIYTRATDYDTPADIEVGDMVNVQTGTANAETFWFQTATVTTIGTDAITFDLFGNNPNNIMTLSGNQTATGSKIFNLFSGTMNGDIDMDGNSIDGGDLGANTPLTSAMISGPLTVNSITFNDYTTGCIIGTTTNNNAAAGSVGEFVSADGAPGTSLTTATAANGGSISLTAGDWDVWGNIYINPSASMTIFDGWLSTASATIPDARYTTTFNIANMSGVGLPVPARRFSLSSTTTVYISCRATFSSTAVIARYAIYARRRR